MIIQKLFLYCVLFAVVIMHPPQRPIGKIENIFVPKNTIETELGEWQIMIMAIAWVESNYNFIAKNEHSSASGILQQVIRYVDDVNRITGYEKYSYEDRFNPEKAVEMFEIIQNHYNPDKNIRIAIRIHSSGFGDENINYRGKVYQIMEIIQKYENFRQIITK